uniref:Putative secreted peptide n=1 Tax=Anopheles braziliensis TaxID=58242 RepID=A0A2M3ZN66_9DIPT
MFLLLLLLLLLALSLISRRLAWCLATRYSLSLSRSHSQLLGSRRHRRRRRRLLRASKRDSRPAVQVCAWLTVPRTIPVRRSRKRDATRVATPETAHTHTRARDWRVTSLGRWLTKGSASFSN